VKELIDDLTGKFFDDYSEKHELYEIENYGSYFLGSILVNQKTDRNYIVDGQQRLTSLTLILIHLHNLIISEKKEMSVDVLPQLIYSQSVRGNSFNMDVDERNECMNALFKDGEDSFQTEGKGESVINLVERYKDIKDLFPEGIKECLVNFTWWLISNVYLIKITSFSDNDAYTIFESMNDRGLSLNSTEMLKGYLLANIDAPQRKSANKLWKRRILELNDLGKEDTSDFFKNWLRAKYAETTRQKKDSGYILKDFEIIASAYHKWIKDTKERIGLEGYENFYDFIMKDFDFYSRLYIKIRRYENGFTEGYEELYFNTHNNFTGQMLMIMSVIKNTDSEDTIDKKIKLVAKFIDIFIARSLVNFRMLGYSLVIYKIFRFTKSIRNKSLAEAHDYLMKELENQEETFDGMNKYRLHKQNRKKVHYLLSRLTYFLEKESGRPSNFEAYINRGKHKPFEIEHILPNNFERYKKLFDSEEDFESSRNKMGNLILLQRGTNQSLSDVTYNKKKKKYKGENLLAQTVAGGCYDSDPNFTRFLKDSKLNYKPYEDFDKQSIIDRNKLYEDTFRVIWNTDNLNELL
jgi:uncharacterized protein with ParB-like and HNH nuclease domain